MTAGTGLDTAALAFGILENDNFALSVLLDDLSLYRSSVDIRMTGVKAVIVVNNGENAVQNDLGSLFAFKAIHTDLVSVGKAILLAADFYYSVHFIT